MLICGLSRNKCTCNHMYPTTDHDSIHHHHPNQKFIYEPATNYIRKHNPRFELLYLSTIYLYLPHILQCILRFS